MNDVEITPALDDISLQVSEWQDELVGELLPALEDMAELEGHDIEAETAILAGKLFLQVTDGDWKQAEGLAAVLEAYFSEGGGSGGA